MKAIFSKGSSLGARAFVFVVFSLMLIALAQSKSPSMQSFRSSLNLIVLPIQYLVNSPIKAVSWVVTSFSTEKRLLSENARLRAHEFLLQSKLQKLLTLEKENIELRELLQSSSHVGGRALVAQLLAVDLNPSLAQLIVNKGLKDKVYVGQPVLDAHGVVGQVVSVGVLTSKVLLLTDTKSAIPVQNYRNRVRAVAIGEGSNGHLVLANVPKTTDIRIGDLLVSSGLGQRYPVGYPVGQVISISNIPGEDFLKVVLRPVAHIDRTQQVLLVWPNNIALASTVQKQLKEGLSQ